MANGTPSTNYYLDIVFSGKRPQVFPDIKQFNITSSVWAIAPTFRIKFGDPLGYYSHRVPLDNSFDKMRVAVSSTGDGQRAVIYDFDIYRRFPNSDSLLDMSGVLSLKNTFEKKHTRSFSGTVYDTISTIASEMGIIGLDISPKLKYTKTLIQPYCNNFEFLRFLRDNLSTEDNDSAFLCYIYCKGSTPTLSFRTLTEHLNQAPKYRFINSGNPHPDTTSGKIYYPILEYQVYDNYKLMYQTGLKKRNYGYFDYDSGKWVLKELLLKGNKNQIDNIIPLSSYFSVNKTDDENIGEGIYNNGRSNSFTSTFTGNAKANYHKNLMDLNKIYISTWGFDDLVPGDIVELLFISDIKNFPSYQYSGKWMIEEIDMSINEYIGQRLLLTRSGITTDSKSTSLEPTGLVVSL